MADPNPVNRRRFFRQGLRELLRPLADAVEPLEEVAQQFGAVPEPAKQPPRPKPATRVALRPPGALNEEDFLSQCSRCGECVKVCPAQCIKIDPNGVAGGGAPYIVPDDMPCVLCEGLMCQNVCPTGAIQPTPLILVDMGTAEWREEFCARTRGEPCTVCIDQCPIGSKAIELVNGRVTVFDSGCTGCGVCQHYCPTSPKSIVVIPKGAR